MTDELGWPGYVSIDLNSFSIISPPQLMREFAGVYGEAQGFTVQVRIEDGIRVFQEGPQQDSFRHAFVHGIKALEDWDHERYLNSLPIAPITKSNEQLFDSVSNNALWWGFANEFSANNPVEQHLMDMWNNGVGVQLAREFMLTHNGNRQMVTNEAFAEFLAEKIRQNPSLFIFDESDPRVLNPSLYNTDYLPDGLQLGHAAIIRLMNGGQLNSEMLDKLHQLFPEKYPETCFAAGTAILLADGSTETIEDVRRGDLVLSYDASGALVPGRVTRTFRNEVSHILEVHGLKVTPGHATLCGEGMFKGRHVPIIDILLSDGALVQADGTLIRMAINAPVGSIADAFVKLAVAATPEDMQSDTLAEAEMRVGTLLFDRECTPISVLDCLTAEGYAFDSETGLVAKPGEEPHRLFWFGRLPRPENYILTRSEETLEGILTDGEWEGSRPELIESRLRQRVIGRVE